AIETAPGKVANRANSRPSFADLVVQKQFDKSGPGIFTWAVTGATKKVQIHFCKEDGKAYLEYTLEAVIPSSHQLSGASGFDGATRVPTETLTLNYTKIDKRFIPYDDKNKAGTPVSVGYDLTKVQSS